MPSKKSRGKRRKRIKSTKKTFHEPRSIEDYDAMSKRDQELWVDISQITTDMRLGASLNEAARKFRRDPRTVQRRGKAALRKLNNGRWAAKRTDRLLRVLQRITPEGKVEVALSNSRQSTVLGRYWNAVELYRDTGDPSRLQEFEGEYIIDAAGNRLPLLTDLQTLDLLGSAGILSFESLYARVA